MRTPPVAELIEYEEIYLDTITGSDVRYSIVKFMDPQHFWSSTSFSWGTRVEEHRFNPAFIARLSQILDQVEKDASIGGLIITGEGRFFSNGVDISFLRHFPEKANMLQKDIEHVMARILSLGVVTVSLLNGHTTAAAAILSLCCDYRIMCEKGLFFLPAVELGIVYSQGFIEVLKAKVSEPVTQRDMALFSKRYNSAQLCRLSVVEKVVPTVELGLEEATKYIRSHWQKNRDSLAEVKRRLYKNAIAELTDERISDMHWSNVLHPRGSKL
jgi:enoyl-CoA hydratase/carnithine racemase